MTDNAFGFMSNKIKFHDDPKFVHIDDTLRCLAYVFIHHLDIWVQLVQKQTTMYSELSVIDAGRIFNSLMCTQPFGSGYLSPSELNQDQYEAVINTLVNCFNQHPKLGFYAKKYDDPYECVWQFCHYFFIPVRLNADSLPRDVRMNSLRKWFNVVYTLPFIKPYTDKYVGTISNVEFLHDVYSKLVDDPRKIEKFMHINAEWVYSTIARVYNRENTTQVFVRVFMNVFLISSVEILKKYCPNYHQCAAINPDYDGSWINPFDHEHVDHLQDLNKLTALLNTEGS